MSKRRRWSIFFEWVLAVASIGVIAWALIHSFLNH